MTRQKFRKIFGSLLIILSLLCFSFPTKGAAADEAKTSDFQINGSVLVRYTGTAKTVSVPATITEIGQEAFVNNSNLTSVILPSNLETISYAAFSGCNNLTSISIPETVTSIGSAAFCNCTALKEVKIGSKVKKLGTGIFTGDPLVKTVALSGNDKFVCEDGVIYDVAKETVYEVLQGRDKNKYVMPDSVQNIMPYAFYGCSKIEDVQISPYLKEIPPYSFSFCNGLKSLDIPFSVSLIDIKAFENCVNLKDVNIKENVNYIADSAFDGCGKLNIIAPDNSYAAKWFENFDSSNVLNIDIIDNSDVSTETEDENDENRVWETEKVTTPIEGQIGETVIVGRQAVFFINNTVPKVLGNQTLVGTADGGLVSSGSNVEYQIPEDWDINDTLHAETNGKGLSLPKFAIIDSNIASKAFYANKGLSGYVISDDITSIGDFSFARSALKEIEIPDSVTHIGYGAFYHCDDLTSVMIPASVTDIEASAFAKTRMMDNWLKYGESDFFVVGDGILLAYRGNSSKVTIPDNVKTIGAECFKDHFELTEITISDSVTKICEEAFANCLNLYSVYGGNNLSIIEDRAFINCPLNNIRIPENVEKIGLYAYDLSNPNLDEAKKVCVFLGSEIPSLGFNKTSTRLANSDYRKDALYGVKVAIVQDETVSRTGTLLDRELSGFSGLICTINGENSDYANGSLKIIDCTLTSNEAMQFYVPESLIIFGKGYNFDSSELNSVINMAKEGMYNPTISNSAAFHIPGLDEAFVLNIRKDSVINPNIKEAYVRIYGDTIPQNLVTYSISMYEDLREVPITKLGNQDLPVSIKLPDNIPTANLHVICVDEDCQLEDLPYKISDNDGLCVQFNISHTGSYGLYAFNSSAVSKYDLDETPDTGDYIHPKWFLGGGLLALGLAFILYRKKSRV